jgi:hypothetical protein
MAERADEYDRQSDGYHELVECRGNPMVGGDVSGEFIVAAAEVLDKRMPGSQDSRGPAAFQAAHRPEPGFQPPVISLDRVVRVSLHGMQRRGNQLVQDPRVGRGPGGGDLAGTVPLRSARVKNRRAAARSRRWDSSTSMTWPCWSIARYKYVHRPATLTYVSSANHRSPGTWRHGRAASMNSGVNRCTQR